MTKGQSSKIIRVQSLSLRFLDYLKSTMLFIFVRMNIQFPYIISGSMYSNPLIQFHNLPVEALKLCDLVGCFRRQSFQSDYNIHNVLTVGFKVIRDRLEILLERVDVFRRLQFDQGIVELIVVIPTSVLTDRGNYFSSSRQLHLLNHGLNSFWK